MGSLGVGWFGGMGGCAFSGTRPNGFVWKEWMGSTKILFSRYAVILLRERYNLPYYTIPVIVSMRPGGQLRESNPQPCDIELHALPLSYPVP